MSIVNSMRFLVLVASMLGASNFSAAQEMAAVDDEVVLVVANHADHRYWKLAMATPLKPPMYPKELIKAQVSACIAIGFFIESDGRTSGHLVLKFYVGQTSNLNSGPLRSKAIVRNAIAQSAMLSLRDARYVPGAENPSRKRGFSYLQYNFSAQTNPLQRNCNIPDLAAFLNSKNEADQGL